MITELNTDTLYSVCKFLSADDIFNFSLVNKQIYNELQTSQIYHLMYVAKFGLSSNPIGSNWTEKFKLRVGKNCQFFTWGAADFGRLGYLLKDLPSENKTKTHHVKVPSNVLNFNHQLIIDVKSTGFCFLILTGNGIYYTGSDYRKKHDITSPGPLESDYAPPVRVTALTGPIARPGGGPGAAGRFPGRLGGGPRVMPRHHTGGDISDTPTLIGNLGGPSRGPTNPNLRLPPDAIPSLRDYTSPSNSSGDVPESSFVTKVKTPGKIISISSGRQHFIGLDDQNHIYTWDTGNSSLDGIRLKFPGLNAKPIRKIKCGWNLSGFYTGQELVVWYSRDKVDKSQVEAQEYEAEASYLCIEIQVIDFHLGNDFIILLTHNGAFVYHLDTMHYYHQHSGEGRTDVPIQDLEPMIKFNLWLRETNDEGSSAEFTKITGCYNNFAIFAGDKVLFGNKLILYDEGEPIQRQLPEGIIEIEMGDYHYLALTDKGELYAWGVESNDCGCLGVSDEVKIKEGRNMKVNEATKVDGKWVAIAAAGWHSGGIKVE